MIVDQKQFKKFLLDSKLISQEDLDLEIKKAEEKNQKLANVLLSDGKISESDLKKMEAFVLGIPFISLAKDKIDFAILSLIHVRRRLSL